jgi:hypothetical protein
MSRILRRPMFRGGRVDSRGTGITSGLGYNNGGRVGFSNGGSGEYVAKNFEDYKDYIKFQQSFKPQLFKTNKIYSDEEIDTMVDQGKFANRPWWDLTGISELALGVSGPSSDFIQGLQYEKTDAGKKDYRQELIDERDELIKKSQQYGMSVPEGAKLSKAAQEEPAINPELAALQEKYNTLEQLLLDQAAPKELTEDEKLAKIEKNKAMIQKAYGSGVADDASAMLLNFAGKALKPEATVKSAFGEFFEEEGKRPSERKKYKDAATTAAINAYLTGQSSFKKFEDELGLYSKKLSMKTKADKEALEDMTLAQIGGATRNQGTSASAKRKSDAQAWLDNRRDKLGAKYVNETNSKKVPVEDLFVEENVGEFFLDQQTGEFFEIIRLEDGTIGKARRG